MISTKGFLFIAVLILSLFTSFGAEAARTSSLTLLAQPASVTVAAGSSVAFTISATSNRDIRYIWYKNGTVLGTKTSTLSISKVTAANAGTFTCTATDSVNTVRCKPFTLTVTTATSAAALSISKQPASTSVYEGKSATFSLSVSGATSPVYTWYKNGTVVGSNSSSLTISNATLGSAGTYSCKVSSGTSSMNCAPFTLTVNQIVRITQQPLNQILNEGTKASLSVAATGTAPISYQWYRNGTALSGATSSTLTYSSSTTGNAGSYYCIVKNPGSSATSTTAALQIAAAAKTGSAQITWNRPSTRADGTTLTAGEIAGYELYHSADAASSMAALASLAASDLSIVVSDLAVGTHYFALATKDINGLQSKLTSTITVNIQ